VYVDGVIWQEVPSFYAQTPAAQVFVVSRSPDQSVTTVTFGDGINGARLTSGSGNIIATYRYGSGVASPPAGRLTTIVAPQPNLGSILNPVAVGGGRDPQSPADVRTNAPASVAGLGRAISATDYETVAASGSGVQRATAYAVFDPIQQRPLVRLYVDGGTDPVAAAQAALAGAEDPNRPVTIRPATELAIGLSCKLQLAPGAEATTAVAAATAAVSALFAPAEMAIGQAVYRSAVAAALTVPGVVAVLDLFVAGGQAEVVPATEGAVYTLGPGQPQIGAA
jgi:predicted phage baseplate assembly protein